MVVTFEVFLNTFLSKMCQYARETTGIYPSANMGLRRSVSEPFVCVELLLRLLVSLAANAHYLYIHVFPLVYQAYTYTYSYTQLFPNQFAVIFSGNQPHQLTHIVNNKHSILYYTRKLINRVNLDKTFFCFIQKSVFTLSFDRLFIYLFMVYQITL